MLVFVCVCVCVRVRACVFVSSYLATKVLIGKYQPMRRVVGSGGWGELIQIDNCLQVCYMTLIGVHSSMHLLDPS